MPLQSTNITIMILKLTPHMHADYTPMSDTPKIHITQHTRRDILFHREQNGQGPSCEGPSIVQTIIETITSILDR